jgi:hypothetical protein
MSNKPQLPTLTTAFLAFRLKGSSAQAHEEFLEATRLQPNNPQYEVAAHPDAAVSAPNGPKPEDGTVSGNTYTNKFFGFTYQSEQDLKKAVKQESHQLLFVMESRSGNQPISMKSVMVSVLEMQPTPITAEAYIKALGQQLGQTGKAMEASGSPEERSIGGQPFWKQNLLTRTAIGTSYGAEFVTTDQGYLLMFLLAAPDPKTLEDLEKSLESVHFLRGSS